MKSMSSMEQSQAEKFVELIDKHEDLSKALPEELSAIEQELEAQEVHHHMTAACNIQTADQQDESVIQVRMNDQTHTAGCSHQTTAIKLKRNQPEVSNQDENLHKRLKTNVPAEAVHLKILIPSIAAGGIIGKGGDTISQIQKETGAYIKMSKAIDYYPGTTERVCLVTGPPESVRGVHNWIMEKVREKPDPNPKPVDGELKFNFERHKQVKILVPNATAGMIIGKGGNYIRQIKDQTGAYVQISQKSKDLSLPERCITIAGDMEQNRAAVDLILAKIAEDPQSASCPNISYADVEGPVASSNPTGYPYAQNQQSSGREGQPTPGPGGTAQTPGQQQGPGAPPPTGVYNNHGNRMNNLNINSSAYAAGGGGGGWGGNGAGGGGGGGGARGGARGGGTGAGNGGLTNNPAMDNLKATLRGSGYSEEAVEEISHALYTLSNYGFLGLGSGLAGLGLGSGLAGLGLGIGGGLGNMNQQQHQQQQGGGGRNLHANLALSNLAGLLGGTNNGTQGPGLLGGRGSNNDSGENTPSVFGSAGSITTTMAGGDTGEGAGSYFTSVSTMSDAGESRFSSSGFSNNNRFSSGFDFATGNQNSFGLGTGMGTFPTTTAPPQDAEEVGEDGTNKKELEVGEYIVGAIIGPGGKGIGELQKMTGANIQISKKGVFVPGTRNRMVTISGTPGAVQRAQYLIQQRVTQEEAKRARQGHTAGHQ